MTSSRSLRLLARRLAYLERVQQAILGAFEPGEARYVVRRQDVVDVVSRAVGATVNNALRREVLGVAVGMGAKAVVIGNRRLFRGLKARGLTEAELQLMARQLTAWVREKP